VSIKAFGYAHGTWEATGPTALSEVTFIAAPDELGCIRYCGRDRGVQRLLVSMGEAEQCDHLPLHLRLLAWVRRSFAV
jgi:hypothetical protein